MYRQGDILLVKEDPSRWRPGMDDVKKIENGVVQVGEATGHAHRVEGAGVAVLEDDRELRFVEATEPFKLVHDEHETIEIPEGFYRVIRQREYGEEGNSYVAD